MQGVLRVPGFDSSAEGHRSRLQGHYGENYVRSVAAAAGLRVGKEDPEPEGIDLMVAWVAPGIRRARHRIEVQVKTTRSPVARGDTIRYSLQRSDYMALTGVVGLDLDLPRYLVVVVVPADMANWATAGADCMSLNRQAYWADLMGEPALPDGQETVTVSVPRANVLTRAELTKLVRRDQERAA